MSQPKTKILPNSVKQPNNKKIILLIKLKELVSGSEKFHWTSKTKRNSEYKPKSRKCFHNISIIRGWKIMF